MFRLFFRKSRHRLSQKYKDIDPEDIFLDAKNLPGFDEHHFEGRIEKPVGSLTFTLVKIFLILIILVLMSKLWVLGVKDGDLYARISENNRLEHTTIFANRGVIYDRNNLVLASNATRESGEDFAEREYAPMSGLAHVVGYVKYPSVDSSGKYYEVNYRGQDGAERLYEDVIMGVNGLRLRETDALGEIMSESVIAKPKDGEPLYLSIDARVTSTLYGLIKSLAEDRGFTGGAGAIMDVHTGELIALTSYPEYDQNILTSGRDTELINKYLRSKSKPFLNRAIGGLYTPGSIVKPVIALAALQENIISPEKKILSTGSITVPNPYDPSKPSIFKDWKAHGWTDMREAIAVSSDTYFYSIGGGYEKQKGLGISLLDKYFSLFGIDELTGIEFSGEARGVIPTPAWKKERFNGDIWRLGDTYITSIGQFGTLMTPINALRMVSALANGGKFLEPSILLGGVDDPVTRKIDISPEAHKVVLEGMRGAVTYGTALGLNVPYVKIASKTGTAEIGAAKKYVHSWSTGFFPYENPRYAFVVLMEKGPSENLQGATGVVRRLVDWMSVNSPEYFEG